MALTDKLTAIADAVRAKTGGAERLTLEEMAAEISGISGRNVIIIGTENLHDNSTDTADKYLTGSGTEALYTGWSVTDYIPIKANTLYAIKACNTTQIKGIYSEIYNSDKEFNSNLGAGGFSSLATGFVLFIATLNGYVRFSAEKSSIKTLEVHECVGSFEYATETADTENVVALTDDIPADVALDILTGGGPAE